MDQSSSASPLLSYLRVWLTLDPVKAEWSLTDHEVGVKGGAWVSGQLSVLCHLRESPAPSSFGTWKWLKAVVEDCYVYYGWGR